MFKTYLRFVIVVLGLLVFQNSSVQAQCNNIFQFTVSSTDATCLNADGTISINNVVGGTSNYTFSLLGGPFIPPSAPPNNHTYSNLSGGVYAVTISDGTCDTTVNITVSVTGGVSSASAATTPTSCNGNTGTITVSHQPSSVTIGNYILSPGVQNNTTGVFNNLPAGTYSVILEDNNGCPFTINNIVISTPSPITDATIEVTPIACKGALGIIKITSVTGGTAPYKYSVNNSSPTSNNTFNNLFEGVYTVTITDNNNCTFSKTVQMQGSLVELTDCEAGPDVTIFFGQNVQLNATKGIGNKFYWSPSESLSDSSLLSPIAYPNTTTTYTFTTLTSEGCMCKDRITVRVIPLIKIPNTFTPNGDGINDIWIITNTEYYENVELNVYNRWGDKVYYVKDYKTGNEWDGASLPDATYYYVLRFKYPKEEKVYEYTGSITIIR